MSGDWRLVIGAEDKVSRLVCRSCGYQPQDVGNEIASRKWERDLVEHVRHAGSVTYDICG